jgi:hypothetical protein
MQNLQTPPGKPAAKPYIPKEKELKKRKKKKSVDRYYELMYA